MLEISIGCTVGLKSENVQTWGVPIATLPKSKAACAVPGAVTAQPDTTVSDGGATLLPSRSTAIELT